MIREHRLSNGVRVVVDPTPQAPLAALYLWFDAGASAERTGEFGLAHLLEHMLFKGTEKLGLGEAAARIEGLGGDLNAYTSFDETVLHATVASSAWKEALAITVDMARNASIDPDEFAREKPVVLEELRGYDNEPISVVADASSALLFGEHPYGRPILGSVDSVTNLGREDLVAFVERAYRPDATILSVAGDVDVDEVLEVAEALLGDWQGQAAPIEVPPTVELAGPRVKRVQRPFDTAVVDVNWVMPALGHADVAALDVLVHALVDARSAPLSERLKHEEGLVLELWSQLSFRRAGGQLSLTLMPMPGKTHAALTCLFEELEGVRRGRLPARAVARAREAILADDLFSAETVDGRANDAAWYTARMGSVAAKAEYRAAIAAVTSEQVLDAARRWLVPARSAVVALAEDADEKQILSMLERSSPIARRSTEPELRTLPGGARLWLLPEDSPVAAVRTAVLGGSLAENPRIAGRSAAWARMGTAGTGDLGTSELSETIDDLAATIDAMSGRNSLGYRASFPASAAAEVLDLVGSLTADPMFEADEWERVEEELREDLRTEADHPSAMAWRAQGPRLWPGHPWRLPILGTAATVSRHGPRALRGWHRGLFTQEALVIAVVGGVDPALAEDVLSPWVEELQEGPSALATREPPAPLRPGVIRVKAGQEQGQVTLNARAGSFTSPDRRALELAAAILGAQSGPLFMDLRERRSLAYQVWAASVPGVDGGTFEVGLSTDPARVDEAHRALHGAVAAFAERGPSAEEVDRYRRMTMGHAAMALQRSTGRAANVALNAAYGCEWTLESLQAELDALTPEDVAKALRELLSGGLVEVLVEPRPEKRA